MALTVNSLTSGANNVDASSFTTASFTPTAGALVLVAATSRQSSSGQVSPAISSSHSLSTGWAVASQHTYDTVVNTGQIGLWAAIAGGSPGAATVGIDFSGTTQLTCSWSVVEVLGYSGSGLGPGAGNIIIQAAKSGVNPGNSTSTSATLSAAADSANRPMAFASVEATTSTDIVPRTNWTEINNNGSTASGGIAVESQWRSDTFETSASATWTDSVPGGLIAIEINAQPQGSGMPRRAAYRRQMHLLTR